MKLQYKSITVFLTLLFIAFLFQKSLLCFESKTLHNTIKNFTDNEAQNKFFGLASYYNHIAYYVVDKDNTLKVKPGVT